MCTLGSLRGNFSYIIWYRSQLTLVSTATVICGIIIELDILEP